MNFENRKKLKEMIFNEMVERVENMNYPNNYNNKMIVIEKLEDLIGSEFVYVFNPHYARRGKIKVTNVEKIITRTMTGKINQFQIKFDITDRKGQHGTHKLSENLMEAVDKLNRGGAYIKLKK